MNYIYSLLLSYQNPFLDEKTDSEKSHHRSRLSSLQNPSSFPSQSAIMTYNGRANTWAPCHSFPSPFTSLTLTVLWTHKHVPTKSLCLGRSSTSSVRSHVTLYVRPFLTVLNCTHHSTTPTLSCFVSLQLYHYLISFTWSLTTKMRPRN